MNANAGALADGVQTVNDLALVVGILNHHLAVDVGGNTAHLVVDCRNHRDRLFGDIHISKVMANLQHRR